MTRIEHIADLEKRIANGSPMADRFRAKIARLQAMTDQEYAAMRAATEEVSAAIDNAKARTIRRLASDLKRKG